MQTLFEPAMKATVKRVITAPSNWAIISFYQTPLGKLLAILFSGVSAEQKRSYVSNRSELLMLGNENIFTSLIENPWSI